MNKEITAQSLGEFSEKFAENPVNAVAQNAVCANGVVASALGADAARTNPFGFSIEVEAGKACNQKQSGRCWMFAAYNVMRLAVMEKLNLENMELSQNYPLFYDKLEKANYFLENILETLDLPLESREAAFLLSDLLGDGGQWDMFRSLTEKYGVVPKEAMPETAVSSMTRELNTYLQKKLREYACTFRKMHAQGKGMEELYAAKDAMMETIYRMLAIALGEPPKSFTWITKDKDDKLVKIGEITPQEFFREYVGWDLKERVTVINAPTADKEYGKTYTVKFLGNVKGGAYPVKYLNLPMDDLRDLTVRMLKDNKAVWFGSDVGQFSDRKGGRLTMDAVRVRELFSTDFPMTKAERLDYGESMMTHAMVITGVELGEDGRPLRWKVENSWGDEIGDKGFFVMDDEWFGEFAYQILIEKSYLSKEQQAQFDSEPVELAPWDPFGSLA